MPRGGGITVASVVEAQNLRSNMARRVDAENKAPLAPTTAHWLSQPNRYDIIGVDTPQRHTHWVTQGNERVNVEHDASIEHKDLYSAHRHADETGELKRWLNKNDLHATDANQDRFDEEVLKPKQTKTIDDDFEKWLGTNEAQKAYTNQIMTDNKAGHKLRNWEEFKKIPEAKAAFEKSKQTPVISKVEGASATYNKATGWMAISFSSIPSPEIRSEMKQNGFRYNPVRKQWVAKAYPYREDIAKKYAGTIQELNIEPNWAAKADRAESLAVKHEQKSDDLYKTSNKMFDVIPFGQPVLVGHYSEKTDRNYRDRAWNKRMKGVEEHQIAEKYADRADRYRQKAEGESPGLIYRRIQKLEADKRKMQRSKADAEEKKSQRGIEWANRMLKLYNDKLDVEYKKYKASGGLATDKVKFNPGDRIYTRHGVGTLVTMSKKTARVKLDPDPRSGREIWLNANRKGESLLSVDDIKAKLTPEQLQTYNQAVERIKAESKIT